MVDLGGYVIILVETHDKRVKLYGSPADKADLEVADEILEINGESLLNSSHTEVISHIHSCIKSRTICLRVKRRSGNKLARELAENSHVQDAFVIAVEQQAKERLEKLSALRKIKPVDMTKLSQQLCESSPEPDETGGTATPKPEMPEDANPIYSAPVSELGSTTNLAGVSGTTSPVDAPKCETEEATKQAQEDTAGGYVTDEELELCQELPASVPETSVPSAPKAAKASSAKASLTPPEETGKSSAAGSPTNNREVLIGDSTRRSSRTSVKSFGSRFELDPNSNNNGSVKNGNHLYKTPEEDLPLSSDVHRALSQSLSLKSIVDSEEMLRCLNRLQQKLPPSSKSEQKLSPISHLLHDNSFQHLLTIHNIIQAVQCFQCPPNALCCDTRLLVQECMNALQSSPLAEAAEILNILNKIEFEGLFFSHDKLAELQGALPWEQCVADMWNKDRPSSAASRNNAEGGTDSNSGHGSLTTSGGGAGTPTNATPSGDRTRVVKIMKQNEPLGATVRNEGERVVIGRVVKGGAAERSGQLHPGDEVIEVNGLKLKGKSVHDICDTLCQMSGKLTFVIIPHQNQEDPATEERTDPVYHYRAHFSYNPDDDLYIPCHELGISFQRGDILHVINREDQHWWQAYRDGEWTQTLAGLIPSLSLQQHRMALQRQKRDQDLKEQLREQEKSPARKKSNSAASLLCAKKANKRKKINSPFKKDRYDVPPYEEMALYYPQANQRRPLILVGPPSIGRHELRLRLLEDISKFAAAVPHTSRPPSDGEIDGQDYNFVSRSHFEDDVVNDRFVEHGEYERQYYGTSLDAVRTVINSGKICVLNLQPTSLQILHDSDLKPYVVFLTAPSLQSYRHQKNKYGDALREDEYRETVKIAQEMDENFGHYFDSVIPFEEVDYVFEQLMYEISLLEQEPQWVPAKWVKTPVNNVSTA